MWSALAVDSTQRFTRGLSLLYESVLYTRIFKTRPVAGHDMVSEGDTCTRCEQGVLVVDDLEGFLLCPSCGYVADDTQLTDTTHAGGTATGAVIAENDDGSGAAGKIGTCTSLLTQPCPHALTTVHHIRPHSIPGIRDGVAWRRRVIQIQRGEGGY